MGTVDEDYECEGCETKNAGADAQEAEYTVQSGDYEKQMACPDCLSWIIYELAPGDLPLTVRRIKNPSGPSTFSGSWDTEPFGSRQSPMAGGGPFDG